MCCKILELPAVTQSAETLARLDQKDAFYSYKCMIRLLEARDMLGEKLLAHQPYSLYEAPA